MMQRNEADSGHNPFSLKSTQPADTKRTPFHLFSFMLIYYELSAPQRQVNQVDS